MDIRPFLEKKIWKFFFGIFQNIPRVPPSYEKIFWVIKNYFTIFPILTGHQLKDLCKKIPNFQAGRPKSQLFLRHPVLHRPQTFLLLSSSMEGLKSIKWLSGSLFHYVSMSKDTTATCIHGHVTRVHKTVLHVSWSWQCATCSYDQMTRVLL